MPRIRSIHYDACKSEKLAAVSAEAERCYWRLLPHCDDDGRCEDDPRVLRSAMFPVNEPPLPADLVDVWLSELAGVGLIVRYECDGDQFLAVTKWHEYQHPNRKTDSKLPPPPDDSLNDHGSLTDTSVSGQGVESAGEGEGTVKRARSTDAYTAEFDCWWSAYPRKINKADARKAYIARRREGITAERLTQARNAYAHARRGEDLQFTRHASSFLAKDGPWTEWENGPPEVAVLDAYFDRVDPSEVTRPFGGTPAPVFNVLPPSRVDTCPSCDSSLLACVCPKENVGG